MSLSAKRLQITGIELKKVADALSHYTAGNYSDITRLKKSSNGNTGTKLTEMMSAYLQSEADRAKEQE